MRSWFSHIDWLLVIPVFVLVALSLATLFSINVSFFMNQLVFFLLCIGVFLFFSRVQLVHFEMYQVFTYILACGLFVIVLLIGLEARGAARWVDFLGIRAQFSEILKPFLLLTLVSFLAHRNTSFKTFGIVVLLLVPLAFLIFKQPDLGSALVYVLVTFGVLVLYGYPWWWFGSGLLLLVGALPVGWRFLHAYQRQRLLTFLHVQNDPLGSSYNAIQAVIAVGSGMWWGKGLGQGTQSGLRFLPERHTDFLFATLSEDLGFLGAALVIVLFSLLFLRLYMIYISSDEVLEKLFVGGAFFLLLVQFFLNIGMNIGIVPIVGIPLPFVSYGGSSLLSNAILLGLVSSVSTYSRRKSMLEIR